METTSSESPREQLLRELRGRNLEIPDLQDLFRGWPQGIHPEVERLRKVVDAILTCQFHGDRLRKMKAADIGLFGALWWPYASFEALVIGTDLMIWLFAWDDETDSAEFSSLVTDLEAARRFRGETTNYVRDCLVNDKSPNEYDRPVSSIITTFKPIGEAIRKGYNAAHVGVFLRELLYFFEMVEEEQKTLGREDSPTVEGYRQQRLGTSAVGPCLAITEFCFDMHIPPSILDVDDMKTLWDETNVIVSTVNDILSIQKEIRQGQVDTLIPLLYKRHGNLTEAMNAATDILHVAIVGFERASLRLLESYSADQQLHANLQKFVYGFFVQGGTSSG